ncbi:type IV secretory system conjugative DNA transfer family protein [Aquitalea pelogenes]|uniref:type IV secretory system conjugative DNA transfer family protein n=1 Tax=Aquitalea pelogenes TaxID=1293573 RepID=UPI0035B0F7EF
MAKEFKLTKTALFIDSILGKNQKGVEINQENGEPKQILYRTRSSKAPLPDGSKLVVYIDDVIYYTAGMGIATFFGITALLWMIDVPIFPRPIPWIEGGITGNYFQHLYNWFDVALHWAMPERYNYTIPNYLIYLDKLKTQAGTNYSNAVVIRAIISLVVGVVVAPWASYKGFKAGMNQKVNPEQIIHRRGAKVHQLAEAERILGEAIERRSSKHGEYAKFARISHHLSYGENDRRTHTLIFGTTGSGKSQWLESHIRASMANCMRTVILDPKREFANAFFDPNNPAHALIDFTDMLSSVPDIFNDIDGPGLLSAVVSGLIPPDGSGNGSMWTDAAQAVARGLIVYLQEAFRRPDGKTDAGFVDMAQLLLASNKDIAYAIFEVYPEARRLVGELNEDGSLEQNVTTAGIMINMFAKSEMFNGVAKYLAKNTNARKISLERFMTDPDYEVKVLFLYPNAEVETISKPFISLILSYLITFIDSPRKLSDAKKPVGTFIMDEAHQPGKLVNQNNMPIFDKLIDRGRSSGWAGYIAVQDINQLWKHYTKEDVNGWLGTTCNFVCCGATGETLQTICDRLGDRDVDKWHESISYQADGVNKSGNWQTHTEKVVIPAQLTAMMERNEKVGIRYFYKPSWHPDAFILEKPWAELKERSDNHPIFIRPSNIFKYDEKSRIALKLAEMNATREKKILEQQEKLAEQKIAELKKNNGEVAVVTNIDEEPSDEDLEVFEFNKNNELNKKIYNLMDVDDADDVCVDVLKDKVVECIFDSHGITTMIGMAQAMATPYKNLTTSKFKFESHKREQLARRFENKEHALSLDKEDKKISV